MKAHKLAALMLGFRSQGKKIWKPIVVVVRQQSWG